MKVVMVSNYMNHHQLEISKELMKNSEFTFVACTPISQERINMGYKDMNKEYDFIVRAYESDESYDLAKELVDIADVVIFGNGKFELVKQRIEDNKLTFKYSERLFKNHKLFRMFYPPYVKKIKDQCSKYKDKNYYLLCSSAFAAEDYAWFGAFKNKAFKWGYFPNIASFDKELKKVIKEKEKNKIILWCGRFIDLKHPEYAIYCAEYLKSKNIDYKIKMIGTGPLQEKISRIVNQKGLGDIIEVCGALPFDKVQEEMRKAQIFLFTSDQNEGWGAVLNESMGNACCVIANRNIGSVPYLLTDGFSGYTYKNKKEFIQSLEKTCLNTEKTTMLCKQAYEEVHTKWTPKAAVESFFDLVDKIINNKLDEIKNEKFPCHRV